VYGFRRRKTTAEQQEDHRKHERCQRLAIDRGEAQDHDHGQQHQTDHASDARAQQTQGHQDRAVRPPGLVEVQPPRPRAHLGFPRAPTAQHAAVAER
jgi:hypothetical protein